MKLILAYIQGKEAPWTNEVVRDYEKRIRAWVPFEVVALESKKFSKDNQDSKLKAETDKILKFISAGDVLILLDERGKSFSSSVDFSKFLVSKINSGTKRIVFMIGGPFGFSEEVKSLAHHQVSLSGLTMNHHVAKIFAIEQIYRALTIWKNHPYHNE